MERAEPWSVAWERALYDPALGFFRRERPLDHFTTSVALPPFAEAVRVLAGRVDEALGRPDPFDLVDLGAGGGELFAQLPDTPARWRLTAVERRPRSGPGWAQEVPRLTGLLVANEWLDSVPLDVLEDGALVGVDDRGSETLTGPVAEALREWAQRWWPGGGRVEVGLARDVAWSAAVAQVERGFAVAVDYGHTTADRRPTLTGHRAGQQVEPVPDGSCDITAHVAVDSCTAATGARLLRQRDALRSLGLTARLPDPLTAAGLERASQVSRLLDPAGLGGFWWLVQEVGVARLLERGC